MKRADSLAPRSLRVLYAGKGGKRSEALTQLLVNSGHDVRTVQGLPDLLRIDADDADVLVLDAGQEGGVRDLLLLEESVSAGLEFPIVLITGHNDFDHCRRALDLGVAEVVQGPFEPTAFVLSVEAAARQRSLTGPRRVEDQEYEDSPHHVVEYTAASDSVRTATRDLLAFLARMEVATPQVARICCAVAEIVDNACRHAYVDRDEGPGRGRFFVDAFLEGARAVVLVGDQGRGLDASRARLDSVCAPLPSRPSDPSRPSVDSAHRTSAGFSRVGLLVECFDLKSDGSGTVVDLRFDLTPVPLDSCELPALDDLLPENVRALLQETRSGEGIPTSMPASLSLVMRRLAGNLSTTPVAIRG